MTEWNFASIYERVADTVGDAPALICNDVIRTWSEYDDRAARLAAVLLAHGLRTDSKAGLFLHNSNEYLEAHHAIFKLRACPVNINYRYKADELRYLLENSDAEALIFQDSYAEQIASVVADMPQIKCLIQVRFDPSIPLVNGALDYEQCLAAADPMPRINRKFDDLYMLYTGGTTGMPKGVMYANGAICQNLATMPAAGVPLPDDDDGIANTLRGIAADNQVPRALVCSPLMHGTALWVGAMTAHLRGGAAITINKLGLDPDRIWTEAANHRATFMTIVGDAFARPLLDALNQAKAKGRPYALPALKRISSSGVMFSQEVKTGILSHLDIELIDLAGATEGVFGHSVSNRTMLSQTAVFERGPNVKVLNEQFQEVTPGSGEQGKIACISIMQGYYKDEKKSQSIYHEIDGERWVFTGDFAQIEADGKLRLIGRGSGCINTAGEKVFPEEVEEVLKSHSGVADCLVVGAPDPRFGQKVMAVVSLRGEHLDEQELIDFCKSKISGYKAPKEIIITEQVSRSPNGKADYKWAKQLVETHLAAR